MKVDHKRINKQQPSTTPQEKNALKVYWNT